MFRLYLLKEKVGKWKLKNKKNQKGKFTWGFKNINIYKNKIWSKIKFN